jgi:2-polyprenyl-3-methyl-5-hydroxy-6-metoxy-1,4-benzoquinol methylase
LPAQISIVALARQSELQERLNLGLTDTILGQVQERRSNIKRVVLEDNIAQSTLPSVSFGGVICVEVVEHVRSDMEFLAQIVRVLKPDG